MSNQMPVCRPDPVAACPGNPCPPSIQQEVFHRPLWIRWSSDSSTTFESVRMPGQRSRVCLYACHEAQRPGPVDKCQTKGAMSWTSSHSIQSGTIQTQNTSAIQRPRVSRSLQLRMQSPLVIRTLKGGGLRMVNTNQTVGGKENTRHRTLAAHQLSLRSADEAHDSKKCLRSA